MSPLPKTSSVKKIMRKLKGERKYGKKQKIAIALTQARKHGAKIPKKKKK